MGVRVCAKEDLVQALRYGVLGFGPTCFYIVFYIPRTISIRFPI